MTMVPLQLHSLGTTFVAVVTSTVSVGTTCVELSSKTEYPVDVVGL